MKFYVYEHWRLDRDECFYVGKGSGDRAYRTNKRNSHWKNIVAKLERNGFAYEVKIVASNLTEEHAFSLERERISFWKDISDLANLTEGGEGISGHIHSEETKVKLKVARNKRIYLDTTRDKISKSLTGIKRSAETKQKISNSRKGLKFSEEHCRKLGASKKGRVAWNKGIPATPEQREKNRIAALAKYTVKKELT